MWAMQISGNKLRQAAMHFDDSVSGSLFHPNLLPCNPWCYLGVLLLVLRSQFFAAEGHLWVVYVHIQNDDIPCDIVSNPRFQSTLELPVPYMTSVFGQHLVADALPDFLTMDSTIGHHQANCWFQSQLWFHNNFSFANMGSITQPFHKYCLWDFLDSVV